MTVEMIRRFPVKSMGGEALDQVAVDRRGLAADRWYAVEDADGRFASGKSTQQLRRRDHVFDFAACTQPDGSVIVSDGQTEWAPGDPALDSHLSHVMRAPVRVTPEGDVMHYDAAPVSLIGTASLRWCAERWGVEADPRRFRVNVLFTSEVPFIEDTWIGRTVAVGTCRLVVTKQIERCRMIDIDQDGVVVEGKLLQRLARERDAKLAAYATVDRPGTIGVGDTLTVRLPPGAGAAEAGPVFPASGSGRGVFPQRD